ncbi:PEP-CTERM sorting domain-containing protein [Haloferula chungangensis]|uniref:PEP-CTERM sorting domain-containing protein n=1 Tax=Haloferula chungangensis TaxID=1048331 RepID=A0ABW2L979_9BACT
MKTKTILGITAAAVASVQTGSADFVLAGWHEFTPNASQISTVNSPANEGVAGLYDDANTVFRHTQATDNGGSTDNWYGPDSLATGGLKTGQSPYAGPQNPETGGPLDPRLAAGYSDPVGFNGAQPGTTMNGRVAVTNDSDILLFNGSADSFKLRSFVFDAFLGEVSAPGASAQFANFTVSILRNGGGAAENYSILASQGFTGVHSNPAVAGFNALTPVDTPFAPDAISIPVPNAIVYGTGTNYVDYLVDLQGLTLDPGDAIKIRFNQTGSGAVRIDNAAFIAVPEPSSALALGGILGLGLMGHRRRR